MSAPGDSHSLTDARHSADYGLGLGVLIGAVLRRWLLVAATIGASLAIAVLFILAQRPTYTATAVVQLNSPNMAPMNLKPEQENKLPDMSLVNSELDTLRSRTLARRVIKKLELDQVPEFNPALEQQSGLWERISGRDSQDDNIDEESAPIRITNNVLEALNATLQPASYTVQLSFDSESPRLARDAVNAFGEEYLLNQVESRFDSSRKAGEWLNQSVTEMRDKVIASERAVQQFRGKHNLYELEGRTLNDQQVEELNSQLVIAQTNLSQARARLSRVRQSGGARTGMDSIPEVLSSELIQKLREQEAVLLRKRSDLTSQFGPKHPMMGNINNEIAELDRKIDAEMGKVASGLQNEEEVAREQVGFITSQLSAMRGNMSSNRQLAVQLDDLKREAEANRQLYETLLASMKETGEAGNMQQVSAKIISKADLPLKPSKPQKTLIMLLALGFGLFSGIGPGAGAGTSQQRVNDVGKGGRGAGHQHPFHDPRGEQKDYPCGFRVTQHHLYICPFTAQDSLRFADAVQHRRSRAQNLFDYLVAAGRGQRLAFHLVIAHGGQGREESADAGLRPAPAAFAASGKYRQPADIERLSFRQCRNTGYCER